jgi:hypothetical protein
MSQVGSSFVDVINKCRLGHFQPSILFYEGEDVPEDEPRMSEPVQEPPDPAGPVRIGFPFLSLLLLLLLLLCGISYFFLFVNTLL